MNRFNSEIEADQKRRDRRDGIIGLICIAAIFLLWGAALVDLLDDEAYRQTQEIISGVGK